MANIKYIAQNQQDTLWGLTVNSVGHQLICPGEDYPPQIHDQEYMFNPKTGRVLSEYQLLYILNGKGQLKTKRGGIHNVKAGSMFIIFPGEWHSYSPDPDTGWDEYWIGFSGTNVDHRVKHGFFSPSTPLYNIGHNEVVVNLYEEAIRTAQRQEPYFQQLMAGIVNHLLGIMFMRQRGEEPAHLQEHINLVNSAKAIMLDNIETNISAADIAKTLNISYSKLRRIFKDISGTPPTQYITDLRIQRAKEMLLGTNASIKEIAITLHFENPEYFSTMFKKKTGLSPQKFREM